MKKADIQIIAVILCIAMLFTIVSSGAVTIASIVAISNDSKGTIQMNHINQTDPNNDSENIDNSADNSSNNSDSIPADGTATDNSSQDNNASPDNNNANLDNSSNNGTVDNSSSGNSNSGSGNSSSVSTGAIDKEALAMYQKAAKNIKEKAAAGYTKKVWQTVAQDLKLDQLPSLSDRLSSMIESFMTSEADAEELKCAKGSEDAKNRFPLSNCTEAVLKSVKKTTSGSNVVITIVMKDSFNPKLTDTDGVTVMNQDLLYIQYVTDTIESNGFVNALVKELTKGDINYKGFKIVATMTKDGKFVEIKHDVDGMIDAGARTILGEVSGTGGIAFHTRYYNFKY